MQNLFNHMNTVKIILNSLRIIKNFPKMLKHDIFWTYFQLRRSRLIKTKESELAVLLVDSHVLEKGLTMPNRRLGFGQQRVRNLVKYINEYISNYDASPIQVQAALNDLAEYLAVHKKASFALPEDIVKGIENLMRYRLDEQENFSIPCTAESYFVEDVDFEKFSFSRRSLRHYSNDKVDIDRVIDAIRIAQNAPSACNRQATRVKIIQLKEAKEYVLSIQNGTRGFGHLADKILLVSTDMSNWAPVDRNSAFLDAGIFTMNLLYALHYKHIAACPLNADMGSKLVKEIHKRLNIPMSEIPVCFITIGNASKEFLVANSQRIDIENVYSIV